MYDIPFRLLSDHLTFPNPRNFSDECEIIAWGGDLNPLRVLEGYRVGVFPWFGKNSPILWWSPNPRLILYPDSFKLSKSFKRVLKNSNYLVTFDKAFHKVIDYCSKIPRAGQDGTWINEDIKSSYIELHKMGYAHSVEVWIDGFLSGGLYGVALGKAFFGESMFSLKSNSSKIALKAISDVLNKRGYDFIDCQVSTEHLISLGAVKISRSQFLDKLELAISKGNLDDIGFWSNLKWEYNS